MGGAGRGDLELDEPVTELGFVASCRVSPTGEAHLRLRSPTYFCAPNFAFLMVADAHDAVDAVPGISGDPGDARRPLRRHRDQPGVAAEAGFVGPSTTAWPSPSWTSPNDFLRKAVLAGHGQGLAAHCWRPVATPRSWADAGRRPAVARTGPAAARRRQLGLPAGDDAALVVDPDDRRTGGGGGAGPAPAPGPPHPGQRRGQRRGGAGPAGACPSC